MQVGEKGLVQGRRNRGVRRPWFCQKKIFLKNRLKWNFITAIYVYLSGNDNGDLCSIERRSVNSVFTAKNGYIIYLFPCQLALTKAYIFL